MGHTPESVWLSFWKLWFSLCEWHLRGTFWLEYAVQTHRWRPIIPWKWENFNLVFCTNCIPTIEFFLQLFLCVTSVESSPTRMWTRRRQQKDRKRYDKRMRVTWHFGNNITAKFLKAYKTVAFPVFYSW